MIRSLVSLALLAGTASVALAQTDTTRTAPQDTAAAVVAAAPAPAAATTVCTCRDTTAKTPGNFSILGMLSLPQGEFSDDGDAETGFGIGAELLLPLQNSPNASLVLGAYYLRNATDFSDAEDEEVTVEGGEWGNFSFMGGMRATFPEMPGFYLQGMAGINIASRNDIEFTDEVFGGGYTVEMESGTAFAFSLGAGKRVGAWDFGIRYLNMGEPELKATVVDEWGEEQASGKARLNISAIVLSVGYSF